MNAAKLVQELRRKAQSADTVTVIVETSCDEPDLSMGVVNGIFSSVVGRGRKSGTFEGLRKCEVVALSPEVQAPDELHFKETTRVNGWDNRDAELWREIMSLPSYGLIADDSNNPMLSRVEIFALMKAAAAKRFDAQWKRTFGGGKNEKQ